MSLLLAFLLGLGYLEVNCNNSPLNLVRICQGDTTNILCPTGRTLKIYTAQYGRFVSGQESCPHKSVRYLTNYNCISDVTPYMEMKCDNRPECVVKATNRNLGDPCRGIFKHLDIKFYCDRIPVTTSSPPVSTTQTYDHTQFLSQEIMKCTKIYTSVLDSAPHKECDALQAYKDCLLKVEQLEPNSAAQIDRVMPTLDGSLESCFTESKQPLVMLCTHAKLKGDCINITTATANLHDFDNSVKSMKVFRGNWALYSDPNFSGDEDRVKPGFTSYWLGIYAPVQGEPISLYSNDLSSLMPVDDVDSGYYFDFTDATFEPTSDFKDVQSSPDFSGVSYSYSEPPDPSATTDASALTDVGYSQWVNLDDISSSNHPHMCRSTYCLLGIRVIFNQIRMITLPTRQSVEDIILNRLLQVYQIYPEQLVLAEIVKRSSEVILEIIDMKGAPKRVIDIAIEIEEDIKHEEFTFTFSDTMIVPNSDRYGVMLKTISEEYLPKRIKLVTDPDDAEYTTTVYQTVDPEEPTTDDPEEPTTKDNHVETVRPDSWFTPSEEPGNNFEDSVQKVMTDLKNGVKSIPNKYFYPLLATALLLFVLACVIISTVLYKCVQTKDYTLIKKAPSNIYIEVDVPSEKKIEGFENPSYLLEEVDHM